MTVENLKVLKRSLEDTLKNVNTLLEKNQSFPVLTQFDEGGYTDGYEHKDLVFVKSEINREMEYS
jgi:glycosidase